MSLNYKKKPHWAIALHPLCLCSSAAKINYWCISQNVAVLWSHMWLHWCQEMKVQGSKKRFPLSREPAALAFAGGTASVSPYFRHRRVVCSWGILPSCFASSWVWKMWIWSSQSEHIFFSCLGGNMSMICWVQILLYSCLSRVLNVSCVWMLVSCFRFDKFEATISIKIFFCSF